MDLVVLVGGHVEERAALLAGIARRAGIRADQERLGVGDRLVDRLQDVGEDRPDHEIDLVAFEQALDLGHRGVRLQFVVDDDDFDIPAGHLAAEILDRERKAVADLLRRARPPGPDSVTITPILIFSCAAAGPVATLSRTRKSGQLQRLHHDNSLTRPRSRNHATPIPREPAYSDDDGGCKQQGSMQAATMQAARQLLET